MDLQEEEPNNYYEILGCSVDASMEEIKKSYHRLALQHHPDKSNSDDSSKIFQRIEQAWRTLSNMDLKKEYDAQLRQSNLEDISILLFSRIKPDELEQSDEDLDVLKYTCRCGGEYKIHKHDLTESNCQLHVQCQECTLVIEINT